MRISDRTDGRGLAEADCPATPLSAALASLYRAYQQSTIYPAGHPSIPEAIEVAAERLGQALSRREALIVGVSREHLIVDDTRGERGFEFQNFVLHMERALPGLSVVALDHDHDIFDSFFRVDPLAVIPMYGPRDIQYYAIFEDNDPEKRMLAVFNFNNDIAEYWEYSDQGYASIELTNEAFKLGVNYVVYAHTH